MGKIAFVFPGQGAQYIGMGQQLAACSPAAKAVFDAADTLRPNTSTQCFSGSEAELLETKNTQPCLFTVELAAAAALKEAGVVSDMTAGFSLGELAALTFSGAVSFADGFELVCKRGALMQQAAEQADTAMVAVVRLDHETVERICAQFEGVYPVNFNCPRQVSVAGLKDKMDDFAAAVKAAGGRTIPLKVSGGFHAPFMKEAAAQFGKLLENVPFAPPSMPLYSNYSGLPYGENIKQLLALQICSPVRWDTIVRHCIESGADTFVELGAGSVLSGLISKIDKSVRTLGVSDAESLQKTIAEVRGC